MNDIMNDIQKLNEYSFSIKNFNYIQSFLFTKNVIISSSPSTIIFHCNYIQSLDSILEKNYLDESLLKLFIYDIGFQLLELKKKDMSITYFNLNDIFLLSNTNKNKKIEKYFLFFNPSKIFNNSINHFPSIELESKIQKFLPPELYLKNSQYKLKIGPQGSYYSFAKLFLYIFNLSIENIYYTKLYFFLNRCLQENPSDRYFLYI